MYIIVSAAHPRHCQPACILPVSKLPGTWREKLRAITEPPLRGVSSLRARQQDSVSMGTPVWPPGCCWHHLMYIFRYKTFPFKSEMVFNGLSNTGGQLLSPKENIVWTLSFSPDLSPRKLELLSRLTLRCTGKTKSYFVQWENYACYEEWLYMMHPNLLIHVYHHLTQLSPHLKRQNTVYENKGRHNVENLTAVSHCWWFNFGLEEKNNNT